MKIVHRLYMKEFLVLLGILVMGFSMIFSLIDLTGRIQGFLPAKTTLPHLMLYSAYVMPKFLLYLLPMSCLITGMFVFSQASRRKEIIAIKAAGGRLRSLFVPFVILGTVLCVFSFLVGEFLAPEFTRRSVDLRDLLEGRTKKVVFDSGRLWLRGTDGSPIKIDVYNSEKKTAKGVSIFVLGENLLTEKIVAERAFWDGRQWVLEEVTRYLIDSGRIEKLRAMNYQDLGSPDLFSKQLKSTDEMDIAELYQYMQRLRSAGFRNVRLAVDINSKISFPLMTVFMTLLGISLALRIGFGGGFLSAGIGIVISLVYGFGYTFFLSMGYAGILHPIIAAWIMPGLFSILSVYLFVTVQE